MRGIKKRGQTWMTEETGRLVLAILVIVLLLFFVSYVVKIFRTNTSIEQANATLSGISELAKSLSLDSSQLFLMESPKGWTLATYPGNSRRLCLCNTPTIKDFEKDCDKKYLTCQDLPFPVSIQTSVNDNKIDLTSVPRAIPLERTDAGLIIHANKLSLFSGEDLNLFLESKVNVKGNEVTISQQMIQVITKKSQEWIESVGTTAISVLNTKFGASGWCIQYSKEGNLEGKEYSWQLINKRACLIKNGAVDVSDGNIAAFTQKIIPYEDGNLKVQMFVLKGP